MRVCPVPGCGAEVADHQLMDHSHWRLVPLPLQKTIVFLWNNGKPRDGYAEACLSAVEVVVERLRGGVR